MDKKISKKLSALDPRFRKKINELFDSMHESISLLYEAATHDEKTGLYNNKFFESVFEMEIEKAKRGQQKLSLVIIDIDYFKKTNDKYGHITSDKLLKKLAEIIKNHVRKSDVVARFGGEEFIVLLPETSIEKAKKFCLRLKKSIHSDKILKEHSITVSGGITQFKGKGDSGEKMKQRADKALYLAKNTGRDRFDFM